MNACLASFPWSATALGGALLAAAAAHAYQPVNTPWPGSTKGVIRLKGDLPPAPAAQPVTVDTAACGTERAPPRPVTAEEGRLVGAMVLLENIPQGKPLLRRQVPLDIKDCSLPVLTVLSAGDELQLGSVDSVPHQVRISFQPDGNAPAEDWGHLVLVPQGQRARFKLAQPGWITVAGVGAHAWIQGRVRVVEHPYAQLTGTDGTFDLRDVPAGTYTLTAWHPQLGAQSRPVEVKAGYPTRVELDFQVTTYKADGVQSQP